MCIDIEKHAHTHPMYSLSRISLWIVLFHVTVIFNYSDNYGTMVIPMLDQMPAAGDDYVLSCMINNEGRPSKIIRYEWFRDGLQLNESARYSTQRNYLIIKVFYLCISIRICRQRMRMQELCIWLISCDMCWYVGLYFVNSYPLYNVIIQWHIG